MMIVIADDLSGAAELAGAAVEHGLSAEVQMTFHSDTNADVVCVDTDSRSLPLADAARRVTAVTHAILAAHPAWIFKKCDSVLRGPVLAEARAVAAAIGLQHIRLVPANPSRGRTINAGTYLIAGVPLDKTLFATDPTHPRPTSQVRTLLDGDLTQVTVPDILSVRDVQRQAELVDASTLPVGGVDFLEALLVARGHRKIATSRLQQAAGKTLLVCGSEASWSLRRSETASRGALVFSLPHDIPAILGALEKNDPVLMGIGNGPETQNATPRELTDRLTESVTTILRKAEVERVLLEGGTTAAAVIGALGWTRLRAQQGNHSGLGVLRPVAERAPILVIKPGSYPWPPGFWP